MFAKTQLTKASPSPSEGGDVPNGMTKGSEKADRRGRLSLLVTPLSYANNTIHSPLHSERGRG
ncbi:hypothetical protein HMPREF0973_00091 [Prevotella veroralis F0319]|uniref:Uncharacterized protein n=1 Tax=Prevotella veroralis F0319 TaxID=649761 RepID=C9MKH1_9BACT|nr:hypothetical protein HMPREF0973_00091 [Prevotella veroralis F0319]